MARYCWLLMQENDSLITHNAFPPNRQPDSLNTNPRTTRSPSETQMQRYLQGPSTRPLRKKMKYSENTCKRISPQGKFDTLAPLLLHPSYLYTRRIGPWDSVLTTELWTVSQYQTSTFYHLSVSYLTRQGAESGLQGWTWRMDTTWSG